MSDTRLRTDCEACGSKDVCKYRERFGEATRQIFESHLSFGDKMLTALKNCPFLKVTVECPFWIPEYQRPRPIGKEGI